MHMPLINHRFLAIVVGASILAFSGWAGADPPSRVARLGYATGTVNLSPAGEDDWVRASINRPLGTGDRVWSDSRARAEIQVGGATIRMSADTGVSILNLDDRTIQLQLTEGTLNVRVRRLEPGQVFEVDTPNLAFVLRRPGEYRIDVDPDADATTIVVRAGQGNVYGDNASYVIDSRQPYRFTGTDLREYRLVDTPRLDDFDRWGRDRDRAFDGSRSARYVSQDVVGYQDLDDYGNWHQDATYGNVWVPTRVGSGWAPYRDGHWAWIDPWGWTWVDDAPWGFAVSHYGRWANLAGTWAWVPGPARSRAYYAPALVVFVGGANFQLTISSGNVGGVAWFPLGPRDVYRPSYTASRSYFQNVNQSNTVINNTVINNVYNNVNVTNIVYANRQVPGAVVGVPATAFVQSQPVSGVAVRVPPEALARQALVAAPMVAPTEKSVRGATVQGDKPPARAFQKPVIARTAPPAAVVGFAAQRQHLEAKPGLPLDDAARQALKPAAPAPVARLVAPTQAPPRAMPTAPPRVPQVAPPRIAAPPGTAEPAERGQAEPRGRAQREQAAAVTVPAVPSAPAPSRAAPPAPPRAESPAPPRAESPAPPRAAAPAPTPRPAAGRGQPDPREKTEPRERAAAAPPAPPPRAVPPRPAPPASVAAPPPVAQQPARRVQPEPAPAATHPQPRPAVAAAVTPPQPQAPAPRAAQRSPQTKAAASKPNDGKRGSNEPKQEDDDRKKKG